jgi:hypothetical protein
MTVSRAVDLWRNRVPSSIACHVANCCGMAKAWFTAMDRARWESNGPFPGPAWIRKKWEWGPAKWPLHWCEAVVAARLDCGAFAALSREAFDARRLETAPVQLVQSFPGEAYRHWERMWAARHVWDGWACDGFAYHEATAVFRDGRMHVWDSTDNVWISPENTVGYAATVAIRLHPLVHAIGDSHDARWGEHLVPFSVWHTFDGPRVHGSRLNVTGTGAPPVDRPHSPRDTALASARKRLWTRPLETDEESR